jgi:hypothetical protein
MFLHILEICTTFLGNKKKKKKKTFLDRYIKYNPIYRISAKNVI